MRESLPRCSSWQLRRRGCPAPAGRTTTPLHPPGSRPGMRLHYKRMLHSVFSFSRYVVLLLGLRDESCNSICCISDGYCCSSTFRLLYCVVSCCCLAVIWS